MASIPGMLSPTAALISCRKTPPSLFPTPPPTTLQTSPPPPAQTGAAPSESIESVYLAAGCDFFADGCNPTRRYCGIFSAPGFGVAGSRLSDDSGSHLLSGSEPDRNVNHRDGPPGASIWPVAGFEPDDLYQFGWHFRRCAAVQPRFEH